MFTGQGNVTFNSGIGTGNTTYYCIFEQGTNTFEIGLGTLSGSTTLERTTVINNSSGNTSKISFTGGTLDVFCTMPAAKTVYLDASGNPVGAASNGFALSNGRCIIRKKLWHKILETIYKETLEHQKLLCNWWNLRCSYWY